MKVTRLLALCLLASSTGGASAAPVPLADHHQHLFSPDMVAVVGLPPGSPRFLGAADIIALLLSLIHI